MVPFQESPYFRISDVSMGHKPLCGEAKGGATRKNNFTLREAAEQGNHWYNLQKEEKKYRI